jgi:hypothetical protein
MMMTHSSHRRHVTDRSLNRRCPICSRVSVQRGPNTVEPVTPTPVLPVEDRKDGVGVVGERCEIALSVGHVARRPNPGTVPTTGRRRPVPATSRRRAFPVRRGGARGRPVVPAVAARPWRSRRSTAREPKASWQVDRTAILRSAAWNVTARRIVRRVLRLSGRRVEDWAGRGRRVGAALAWLSRAAPRRRG